MSNEEIDGKNKIEICPWHPRWSCRGCGELRSRLKRFDLNICSDCGEIHNDKNPFYMKIVRWRIKYVKKGFIFKRWKKVSEEMEYKVNNP